jgi:hypothetical protein
MTVYMVAQVQVLDPEQLYRNGPAAFQEPQGAQRNAQVHQSRQHRRHPPYGP